MRAQRLIVASLQQAFPGLTIVGEEGALESHASDIWAPDLSLCAALADKFPEPIRELPASKVCWHHILSPSYVLSLVHRSRCPPS